MKASLRPQRFLPVLFAWLFWLTAVVQAAEVFVPGVALRALPIEAQQTVLLIRQGGSFPYEKDASVFGNYEGRLPRQPRGYYHEYTVPTPRARNRGPRRIIVGGAPRHSSELYYTEDHYRSFRRIEE